jgi:hypothetical protein
MKNLNKITLGITLCCLIAMFYSFKTAEKSYEFKTITIVESIVPSGIGRSRIINALEPRDYKGFTKTMTNADKKRNQTDRKDIRVKNYEETKLLNFYNLGGIRFQNIAANDAVIDSRVNAFLNEGWEIVSINTGVEASSGNGDANGIYVTRFYFKRLN